MRTSLLSLLCVLAVGCTRESPAGPEAPEAPPSGRGIHQDGQRTLFQPLGVIAYGDDADGQVPDRRALPGYEFEATAGDEPVVSVSGPGRVMVALYGPRGADGLWDNALQSGVDTGNVTLSGQALPASGMYFVLVRTLDAEPLPFDLRLRCGDGPCAEPDCAVDACDLYCPAGYAFGEDLCRQCACVEPACQPGTCPDGERCVQGVCQARACEDDCPRTLAQVCGADGQTYRTACNAACRGVEVAEDGPCREVACDDARPCPGNQVCERGACVDPVCDCPIVRAPVCDTTGRTHANECQMRCTGAELDYPGPCVAGFCRGPAECAADEQCEPRPDPENLRRCQRAPESEECIRQCVPGVPCGTGPACAPGERCIRVSVDEGYCTGPCREPGSACDDDRICYAPPGIENGGLCLPRCGEARECPGELVCHATDGGPTCLPAQAGCDCPRPEPGDAVCVDGQTYASACLARCAGAAVEGLVAGPCREPMPEPMECDCPVRAQEPLVCGSDRRLYASFCEVRCNRVEPLRPDQCVRARLACRQDEDCMRTGCDGLVCASQRTDFCPEFTETAQCRAENDTCGCVNNVCQFSLSRASAAECLDDGAGEGERPDAERP